MLTTHEKFAFDEGSARALAAASQDVPQLVERIFTDLHGRQFRMVFMVAVVEGELKGRLVSVHPLSSSAPKLRGTCAASGVICLPVEYSEKEGDTLYISSEAPTISPYVSLEFLMTSQPTRAPSFS